MVRHIALLKVKPETRPEQIEALREAMVEAGFAGRVSFWLGVDAGLRPGNVDVAMISDFEDEPAYLAFDTNPEHERIRRELLAPIIDQVTRIQSRT